MFRTIFVLLCSARLSAQTTPDLNFAVRTMQSQVSSLQSKYNTEMGDTRMGVVADIAYGGVKQVTINGWAFKCGPTPQPGVGEPPYTFDLLIDGMPANPLHIVRSDRPDVETIFAAYCQPEGMPAMTGYSLVAHMSNYVAGSYSFVVRIKDARGVVLSSNTVTATIF